MKKTAPEAVDKPRQSRGRPSKYKPEYAEMARKVSLLGTTNQQLADFFEVGIATIDRWLAEHRDFRCAVKEGREIADAKVADSLFRRATGYEHLEDDIRAVNGEIVITPTVKRYAPDTTAAIFWLKNRQREQWRDKQEVEHSVNDDTAALILAARRRSGKSE